MKEAIETVGAIGARFGCSKAVAMIAAVGLTGPVAFGDVVFDDFDNDNSDEILGELGVALPMTPAGPAVMIIDNPLNRPVGAEVDTGTTFQGDSGALCVEAGAGAQAMTFGTYDNAGAGLGLDFVAMELGFLQFDFALVDQAFGFTVILSSDVSGSNEEATAIGYGTVEAGVDIQTVSLALSGFDLGSEFSFDDIDSISLVFNTDSNAARLGDPSIVGGLDFIATEFRGVVPTPGAATVMALSGLLIARRRRG